MNADQLVLKGVQTSVAPMRTKQELHQFQAIIQNLPFRAADSLIEKQIAKLMSFSHIAVQRQDGRSKGFAFVTFDSKEKLQKALEIG